MSKAPETPMSFSARFLAEVEEVARPLDAATIETLLASVRERSGRLFILGVGGSAGNALHAVNHFRKLVGIETYAPTDNVSELTPRVNLNMTAPLTLDQVWEVATAMARCTAAYLSVFAKRIADTIRDPVAIMAESGF